MRDAQRAKAVSRGHQDAAPQTVRRVLRTREPLSDDQVLRERILTLLRRSPGWGDERWSWWRLRQAVGGAVSSDRFRMIVDDLIEEGLVVEAYEDAGRRQTPRHLVVLASRWHDHDWGGLIEVHGREDVLEHLTLIC